MGTKVGLMRLEPPSVKYRAAGRGLIRAAEGGVGAPRDKHRSGAGQGLLPRPRARLLRLRSRSHIVSSGNEATVSAAAFLEYLLEDAHTAIVGGFIEAIREPERFAAALDRAAALGKPVVMAIADPDGLQRLCQATVQRITDLPAVTLSQRLLADKAAEAFTGLADAFDGLALIVGRSAQSTRDLSWQRLRVPDWLPALVNAARGLVTIGAVALFWIVTGWPGDSGAITFAAIVVLLLSPPRRCELPRSR
jgi:uncharacterized membrane protein YccC